MSFNGSSQSISGLIVTEVSSAEVCFDIKELSTMINPLQTDSSLLSISDSFIIFNHEKIPLFDLASSLGTYNFQIKNNTKIIVIIINDKKFCFFVDNILEIITFNNRNLNHLVFMPNEIHSPFIEEKILFEDRVFLHLNLEKIFDSLSLSNSFLVD